MVLGTVKRFEDGFCASGICIKKLLMTSKVEKKKKKAKLKQVKAIGQQRRGKQVETG